MEERATRIGSETYSFIRIMKMFAHASMMVAAIVIPVASTAALIYLKSDNEYLQSAERIFEELTGLAILVFVFEILHNSHLQNVAEMRQKRVIRELLFLIDEKKSTQPSKPKTTDFGFAVDETVNKIDRLIFANSYKQSGALLEFLERNKSTSDLAPLLNEELFINLDKTFDGIQDLIIESQGKEGEFHNLLLKTYREVQILVFLSSRYHCLKENGRDFAIRDEKITNILNVLIGVIFSLDRLLEVRIKLGSGSLSGLPTGYEISHSVVVRLFAAIHQCYEVMGIKEEILIDELRLSRDLSNILSAQDANLSVEPLTDVRLRFCKDFAESIKSCGEKAARQAKIAA